MLETRSIDVGSISISFVRCPAGAFRMGSEAGLPLEEPCRDVKIRDPFWISATLVTQRLWNLFMSVNPSEFAGPLDLPVDGVSYDLAIDFCQAISEASPYQFQLPTEAQWEYACRAGTTTEYFWGSSESAGKDYCWYDMNSNCRTHPVAALNANPWGIYDMVGNLWEWCTDDWHSDYIEAPNTETAWLTPEERRPHSVLRGGAWDMDLFRMRSAYRSYDRREVGTSRFGLRLVAVLANP